MSSGRRRPQRLQENPPLFFSSPTPHPPPPEHTRKGFPDTLAEVPQFPEPVLDHFRWGKSHLFGTRRVALGPRAAERDGWGQFLFRAMVLAKGFSKNLHHPSFPRRPEAAAASAAASDSPTPLNPIRVSVALSPA